MGRILATVTPSGQGGTYQTLEAALHASEQNLTDAGGDYLDIEISGDWTGVTDDTAATIHNYTVGSGNNIHIYTVGDANHGGNVWKASAYRRRAKITVGAGGNYLVLEDLIFNLNDAGTGGIAEAGSTTNAVYNRCFFYNGTSGDYGINLHTSSNGTRVTNCVFFDMSYYAIYLTNVNSSVYAYNCVAHTTGTYGIMRVVAKNCYAGGNVTSCFYQLQSGSDYLVSSDNSADDVGTHYAIGKNQYANYFVSVTAGSQDYHLKASSSDAAIWGLAGTDLSGTFTDDIDAGTRTNWDIGADEYGIPTTSQYGRPSSDVSDGNWTNSQSTNVDLYSYIDETAAGLNDSDYIQSGATPVDDTCVMGITGITNPGPGTVTIRVRARFL